MSVVKATSNSYANGSRNRTQQVEAPPSPFTIPQPVPDFKGYEAERAAVAKSLTGDGAAAVAVLYGMGGTGKSELAHLVAADLADHFTDGEILVDMQGTKPRPLDAAAAMTSVLVALGVDEIRPETRAADYRSRLNGKRLLVLLDDAASGAGLRDLVPPPPAALLITSRTRIALAGVAPIELVRLTRVAAKALLASLVPDPDGRAGRPPRRALRRPAMALRVAGSYLQETAFAPDAYLEELAERRLQHMTESAADIERPELDPMVVLGHSYDRLADSDAALARTFTLLSVFPADFDVAAATAVLDSDDAARNLALLQGAAASSSSHCPAATACTTSCVSWRWRRSTRARKTPQAGGIVNTIWRCSPGATRRSRDVAPTTASPSKPSSET